jgi:hypothetical protein
MGPTTGGTIYADTSHQEKHFPKNLFYAAHNRVQHVNVPQEVRILNTTKAKVFSQGGCTQVTLKSFGKSNQRKHLIKMELVDGIEPPTC